MKELEYMVIGCYLVALIGYWIRLGINVSGRFGWITQGLAAAGWIIQTGIIFFRWAQEGNPPVIGYRDTLFFLSFAIVGLMHFIEYRYAMNILGAFVMPVAALCVVRLPMIPERGAPDPQLVSLWLPLHAMGTFISYALFITTFGVGIAYLIQERQLKAKHVSGVFHRLPDLDVLDRLSFSLIAWAAPLLVGGVVTGMMWTHQRLGVWFRGDPKEIWVLITLLLYAVYLACRMVWGWRGRSAVYLSLAGFVVMLMTYIGVNVVSGRHHYL